MKTMTPPEMSTEHQLKKLTQALKPDGDYGNVLLCEMIAKIERVRALIGAGPPETRKSLELELARVDRAIELASASPAAAFKTLESLASELLDESQFLLEWTNKNPNHRYIDMMSADLVQFPQAAIVAQLAYTRNAVIEAAVGVLSGLSRAFVHRAAIKRIEDARAAGSN